MIFFLAQLTHGLHLEKRPEAGPSSPSPPYLQCSVLASTCSLQVQEPRLEVKTMDPPLCSIFFFFNNLNSP